MYEKALSIELKKLGDDHPSVTMTYHNMAGVYYKQGKYEEARQCTRRLCRSD